MELIDTSFPASWAQRRLWFIQTMLPTSTAYNMVLSTELPVEPNRNALQWALNSLAQRHEVLRTSFALEDGEPIQVIAPDGGLQLSVHELAEGSGDFSRLVSESAAKPFELTRAPLARVLLGTTANSHAFLALVIHHIVADGQTLRILMADLDAMYRARVSGEMLVLPELSVQYADYAVWQRRSLSGRRLESLTQYWKHRLEGLPELDLHHDRPRSAGGSERGSVVPFRIPPDVVARLRALAMGAKTTLFSALLAGLSGVLARFSGQPSFAIGVPVSGRAKRELERVAGLFINSVVFRAHVTGEETFEELVRRTGSDFADDLSHQELPCDLVVDTLGVKRRADRNPLFQVMCQLQMAASSHGAASEQTTSPAVLDELTSQLDMSFIQFEADGGVIEGGVVYAADLFDRETITQLVDAYLLVLDEGSRRSATPVAELPILTASRRDLLLASARGESRSWPAGELLHELVRDASHFWPDSQVVEADGRRLTFEQLDDKSSRVASALRSMHVAAGSVVGICLPRSTDLVIAVLGVLRAGAAYLVLDSASPSGRLKFILSDCDAAAVIVPEGGEALACGRAHLMIRDAESAAVIELDVAMSPDHPAYVIYTSGSAGQPKGVAIPHRAIVNHMRWMSERFPLTQDDRVLQRTPLTFDASVWELFAPLISGATLVLAPHEKLFDPAQLGDLVRRERITTLQVVPSLLRAMLDRGELQRCPTLRRVFCGGEALTADLRARFLADLPAELCNLYGPTETTVDATYHVCRSDEDDDAVPIGRPIANVVARVLDDRRQLVPCGVAGELYVGGLAVGIGYIGRPDLTAERFIDDPYSAGERLFRTGDRVRVQHDGTLHFLGRFDDQIKLRGFRIEPGEIDAALLLHPDVTEAATVVQDLGATDQRLVAFVVTARPNGQALAPELLGWLRSRLPAYQVPSTIEIRSSLPRTSHGKIDRRALALSPITRSDQSMTRSPPRNDREREICRCFGETLKVDDVGIDDDFFLLGGHSLLVVALADHLSRALDSDVTVVDVFEFPTPRQLGEAVASRMPRHPVRASRVAAESRAAGR